MEKRKNAVTDFFDQVVAPLRKKKERTSFLITSDFEMYLDDNGIFTEEYLEDVKRAFEQTDLCDDENYTILVARGDKIKKMELNMVAFMILGVECYGPVIFVNKDIVVYKQID